MATVTGMTAARMLAIEAASVVNGAIVGGHLILTRQNLTTIDAGNVVSVAVVTSGTRPGSPSTGLFIYETDTKRTYVYDGTGWRFVGNKYICTAATRPTGTALFEGLEIYETDTKRIYVYNGTAWIYITGGTNPTAVRAYRNAAFNTTVGGTPIVVFDTENYDYGNNFATGTGRYTSPIAGLLDVKSRIAVANAAVGVRYVFSVFLNGAEHTRGTDVSVPTAGASIRTTSQIATTIPVAIGDLVDVRINQIGGSAMGIDTGTEHAWLTIAQSR